MPHCRGWNCRQDPHCTWEQWRNNYRNADGFNIEWMRKGKMFQTGKYWQDYQSRPLRHVQIINNNIINWSFIIANSNIKACHHILRKIKVKIYRTGTKFKIFMCAVRPMKLDKSVILSLYIISTRIRLF